MTEDPATGGRHWWRELVTDTYRHAREAWRQGRESGQPIGYAVAGGANSDAAAYQLSDTEYAELCPPPTFRDALVQLSSGRIDPYGIGGRS